jgi:pimeloyl-ACP methyl ester carboxylesterase
MAHFKFPVGENLKEVKAPVTIFHGTDDETIPYKNAAKLKKDLKPGDEFITIEKGTHSNLNDFPLFHEKLDSVLNLQTQAK